MPIPLSWTGGVPSQTQPYSWPAEHAKDAISPSFQYSFMALTLSHTSVQPTTKSFGGTLPPSLSLVANIVVHASSLKRGLAFFKFASSAWNADLAAVSDCTVL